jgi:3'-phosphoadenosine 5'-phosphosulfate sulfotransferase (PAPS reductase)/FAD synthetase
MIARWEQRWTQNVARYARLECVKLILPWSTPRMRFCTSELKVGIIVPALKRRFPHHEILNVTGIRHQESARRAGMAIASHEPRLNSRTTSGMTWNAIIDWPVERVFSTIENHGLALHEAYTSYNATRVSCSYCVLAALHDLQAGARCADNRETYRALVQLETRSTFGFQDSRWLADVAPHILDENLLKRVRSSQIAAKRREDIEAQIPPHLLYTKGWPTHVPTASEAQLLAEVRRETAQLVGITAQYLTGPTIQERYVELIAERDAKNGLRATKSQRHSP